MNAAPLGRIGRLYDPDVTLGLRLAQLLVVGVEIVELLGQDVSVRNEVELGTTETLLHLDIVVAQTVLSCNLITLREMIDALELI